ncbi:NACHT domain-containing protein [Saccharothrix longispora]|uniref:NACHT domain-containing protein n=1 Tax=Saccharothrix longispora TaxID=33920 RepID=A0ABU1PYS1_9PSEU|nr:NACHT domain-containing protein [Saccharothrix longispora]MDR6595787.1 hypothetical protein [Saccharothrix longispora]
MDSRRLARASRLVALVGAGSVTCLVLVPIAVNTATGGTAPRVLGSWAAWLWPALAVLAAVTACLAAWEPLRARLPARRPAHPANRASALDGVERFVRERLDGSLAEQVRLKLGVVPRVGPRPPTRLRVPLVVVGEPGAGKTTLLLDLAGTLVARARDDPGRPVPVVVDVGGWRRDEDFAEWLLLFLAERYGIGARVGRVWLRDRRLALLLDGLDELAGPDRAACLDRVAALRPPQLVLCAVDDVDALPGHDVLRVEPLRRSDVTDLITACGPRLDGLRETLTKEPDLWDEIRTPLAFGLLALAHRAGRAEYRGVVDTYLVESAARGATRPERLVRALRFLALIARRRGDLAVSPTLPPRRVWLDFVGPAPVWRLFRRAAPGALAGAAVALCFAVGVRFGLTAAGCAAVATLSAPRGDFPADADGTTATGGAGSRVPGWRGARWAAIGFTAGALLTGGLAVVGGWVGAQLSRWPSALGFGLVVVVSLLVAHRITRDRYWAVACALVPAGVMVLTGPSGVLAGLGAGLAAGAAVGVFVGGLGEVWSGVGARPAARLRWLPVAGLVGVGSAALAGAAAQPAALAPATGLLLGLAVTPLAVRPWQAVAELLARPLALDEFPLRRGALVQAARDRVLLVDGHRFPHAVVRDHLAACDPVDLAATVRRRRTGLDPTGPTGSGSTA